MHYLVIRFHRSSPSPAQLTPATVVKLEQDDELITILSEDSDGNSPKRVLPSVSPLVDRTLSKSSQKSPSSRSHPPPHIVCQRSTCIVDALKRIQAMKGVRNVFKTLHFDTLDIQRVKFLPPTFNGDVLFMLPPVDKSGSFHMMHGMDKCHDGHA